MSEDVEDVERLDVHHRSGFGCLTSIATHTSVSHEPKMYWVKMMGWVKVLEEVAWDVLDG